MDLAGTLAGVERWRLKASAVLLVVLAALAGHAWGQREAEVTVRHGFALSAEGAISVSTHDDGSGDFSIPRDVPWLDSAGEYHEDGRPECLPPVGIGSIEVTYATVPVPSEYGGDRTVRVDCSGWDESMLTQRQRENLASYRRDGPAPFLDVIE